MPNEPEKRVLNRSVRIGRPILTSEIENWIDWVSEWEWERERESIATTKRMTCNSRERARRDWGPRPPQVVSYYLPSDDLLLTIAKEKVEKLKSWPEKKAFPLRKAGRFVNYSFSPLPTFFVLPLYLLCLTRCEQNPWELSSKPDFKVGLHLCEIRYLYMPKFEFSSLKELWLPLLKDM